MHEACRSSSSPEHAAMRREEPRSRRTPVTSRRDLEVFAGSTQCSSARHRRGCHRIADAGLDAPLARPAHGRTHCRRRDRGHFDASHARRPRAPHLAGDRGIEPRRRLAGSSSTARSGACQRQLDVNSLDPAMFRPRISSRRSRSRNVPSGGSYRNGRTICRAALPSLDAAALARCPAASSRNSRSCR